MTKSQTQALFMTLAAVIAAEYLLAKTPLKDFIK